MSEYFQHQFEAGADPTDNDHCENCGGDWQTCTCPPVDERDASELAGEGPF